MKCAKCGSSYRSGSHYCPNCGTRTAEGGLALAISDFATAAKHLAHETARVGKTGLQRMKPGVEGAIQEVSRAARGISVATVPASQRAIVAAATAIEMAAKTAEKAALELRKVGKSR